MENENQKSKFEEQPVLIEEPVTFVVSGDIRNLDTAETLALVLDALVPDLTHTATISDTDASICDHVFSAPMHVVDMVIVLINTICRMQTQGGIEVRLWE